MDNSKGSSHQKALLELLFRLLEVKKCLYLYTSKTPTTE